MTGTFDIGRELFAKARAFLLAPIESTLPYVDEAPGDTESLRLQNLALCNWFIDGRHDALSLKESVTWKETSFFEADDLDQTEVQLSLATYLDAEAYDTLIDRFECTKIKPPKNIRQIRGEGTMAYVIARQRLGLEFTQAEIRDALERFLKRNMDHWLTWGHSRIAAQWMKIAFWKPGDDPIATFLKCYDYLPGLEPPAYPPAAAKP